MNNISIHAPREGGDNKDKGNAKHKRISIHAPRKGGDTVTSDITGAGQ